MDAEEVEHQCANGDKGRHALLGEDVTVRQAQLLDGWRFGHGDRPEADDGRRVRPVLNDLVLDLLPLASVGRPALGSPM